MTNHKRLPVLIVDDERNLRETLAELIEAEGFTATQAADGAEAVRLLRERKATAVEDFAAILLDLRMPRMNGLEVLERIREEEITNAPVVIISAFGDSTQTIEAMRRGAYDYITKPLDANEILRVLTRAAEQRRLAHEAKTKQPDIDAPEREATMSAPIIGSSRAMREIFKQTGRVAATDATVLITGESGTGKELVAHAIHAHSARVRRPFVAINCGALPENLLEAELFGHERGAFTGAERQKKGRFELADTGTLFLDEVGELTPAAQVKLLRVLQERRFERVGGMQTISVDVRVIAATNRDLQAETEARRFREDLFYRLSVVTLHLPPLRERLADVPQLAEFFIERAARRHKLPVKILADDALRALMAYDYPGNVRELENMIERALVTSGAGQDVLLAEHLFAAATHGQLVVRHAETQSLFELPFHEAVARLEREMIRRALEAAGGNRTEAARRLGINRRLLYTKLEEHKLA